MFSEGHAMYVQAVLVLELAVRFVMEDMGVEVGRAREIESQDVRYVLCVSGGDIVDNYEDDPN